MSSALAVGGWWLAAVAAVEVLFGLAWNREGLGLFRRWRFWAFIAGGLALGPFFAGGADAGRATTGPSWAGLWLGLEMAGRALALTLAFSLGLSSLTLSDLVSVFDRPGLRGLGFALGVAMNLLGTLQTMARVTFETIKLRGGLRRPLAAMRLFLVTLVSNTLRYGDQIVQAASVRGFDPQRGRIAGLKPRRSDLWLIAALACLSLIWYLS